MKCHQQGCSIVVIVSVVIVDPTIFSTELAYKSGSPVLNLYCYPSHRNCYHHIHLQCLNQKPESHHLCHPFHDRGARAILKTLQGGRVLNTLPPAAARYPRTKQREGFSTLIAAALSFHPTDSASTRPHSGDSCHLRRPWCHFRRLLVGREYSRRRFLSSDRLSVHRRPTLPDSVFRRGLLQPFSRLISHVSSSCYPPANRSRRGQLLTASVGRVSHRRSYQPSPEILPPPSSFPGKISFYPVPSSHT
ncbi:hypothetical protein LXL04_032461 [Taraxacum kok-saghyz]